MTPPTEPFGLEQFREGLARLRRGPLQLPPLIDPVKWAEENVRLPRSVSSRPGKFRFVKWQEEPYRAMCGRLPGVNETATIKCTQVGLSLIAILAAAYLNSYEAAKVTIGQPKQDAAQAFAEEDLDPVYQAIPAVRAIIRPKVQGETKDKWWLRLFLNGATLRLVGAAANNAFRSYKSRAMFLDEIDDENWQDNSEQNEGDKLKLADQRTETFWNSIVNKFSTPKKRSTSLIAKEWAASDQRRYHMPCPHCGHMQHLRFGGPDAPYGLKFTRDDAGRVTEASYLCENATGCDDAPEPCGRLIPESAKLGMIARGEWRRSKDPTRPGLAGYHVSRLLSTSAKASWKRIGQQWFEAQGDADKLMVFVTLTLGEPWEEMEVGGGVREGLAMRAEPYVSEVPDGVKHLLMSVDTNEEGHQDGSKERGLEVQVIGVGAGEEAWVVAYDVLSEHEPWSTKCREQLDALRRREWRRADGTTMRISVTVCDRGAMPDDVLDYCRSRWQENVWAIKGGNLKKGFRAPSIAPGKPSRNRRTGHTWFTVDTQGAKDLVNRRLRRETPGPGYVHFHPGLPDRYFKGLAAEKLTKLGPGKFHWEHTSSVPNEPWDTLVYCYVALELAKNASPRIVADVAAGPSRGPGVPPRVRYDGPNRAWVSPRQALAPLVDALRVAVAAVTGSKAEPSASPAPAAPPQAAVPAARSPFARAEAVVPAAEPPAGGPSNPWGANGGAPGFRVTSSFMDRFRRR